ncbi:MAG: TerB family tellurite resistance protein [Gemmatimonadales bacterium]
MHDTDREPILAICLMAALADGRRPPTEQEELARLVARFGGADPAGLSARVQSGRLNLEQAAAGLSSQEARRLAYELAVTVVYADGEANPSERAFLERLRDRLAVPTETKPTEDEARSIAQAPLAGPIPDSGPRSGAEGARPSQAGIPAVSHDAALDHMIRQQALLTGALELLPQTLATLAIIPIQMRLVYRIGADYGQKLDADQVKDLLGAMGIGTAAQLLDGAVRRLLGGSAARRLGGGLVGAVAGAGLGFVTTYALGHAAKQYYEQGRRLSRADLLALFERLRSEAGALVPAARTEMQELAQRIDLGRLLTSIKGG